MFKGNCLCGQIKYEIDTKPEHGCYCFCSICRRLTGSEKGAYGAVPLAQFAWLEGQDKLTGYNQNKHLSRWFCSQCSSLIASYHQLDPKHVHLSLGTLEDGIEIAIEYQQFVGSKAPWARIDPSLPQYKEWPDWYYPSSK